MASTGAICLRSLLVIFCRGKAALLGHTEAVDVFIAQVFLRKRRDQVLEKNFFVSPACYRGSPQVFGTRKGKLLFLGSRVLRLTTLVSALKLAAPMFKAR